MNKENIIFTLVMVGILLMVFGMWFFNHSSSPYFAKSEHTFIFDELGTLVPGAKVRVGGLHLGYVTEVKLTPGFAMAKANIDEKVEIPKDSKIRIINVGLVGERVLNIELGDSPEIYQIGDKISGVYDLGSVGIVVSAMKAIDELVTILDRVDAVFDSTLLHPKRYKAWQRITNKAVRLSYKMGKIQKSSESDVRDLIADLKELNLSINDFSAQLGPEMNQLESNSRNLKESSEHLKQGLVGLQSQFLAVKDNMMANKESSIYHMMEDPKFKEMLDSTLSSWTGLHDQLINRSHTINVDIF